MTDPQNTPDREPGTAEAADANPRKRSNWLLWLLLLLAVLLAAWYWFTQRQTAPEPAAPPVEITSPAEEAAEADRVSRPEREARPEARTEPGPPVTTPATPLAGNPAPAYPPSALRVGQGGTVVLKVEVDAQGNAGNISFARRSSSRELDRAAREAVQQWRFSPAMRDGEPIASTVEVPVEFSPPQ